VAGGIISIRPMYSRARALTYLVKNKDVVIITRTGTSIMQIMMERKLNFFGHICRMQDERLIKHVVFGIMDGKNKRGRPSRRETNDLQSTGVTRILAPCTDWRWTLDRMKWTRFVKYVVDTNGH